MGRHARQGLDAHTSDAAVRPPSSSSAHLITRCPSAGFRCLSSSGFACACPPPSRRSQSSRPCPRRGRLRSPLREMAVHMSECKLRLPLRSRQRAAGSCTHRPELGLPPGMTIAVRRHTSTTLRRSDRVRDRTSQVAGCPGQPSCRWPPRLHRARGVLGRRVRQDVTLRHPPSRWAASAMLSYAGPQRGRRWKSFLRLPHHRGLGSWVHQSRRHAVAYRGGRTAAGRRSTALHVVVTIAPQLPAPARYVTPIDGRDLSRRDVASTRSSAWVSVSRARRRRPRTSA